MRGKRTIGTDTKPGKLPDSRRLLDIVAALVSWFERNARDLPWRRTTDPYAIWVSEIMLQQTQVKTVVPYWTRWMAALPDIGSLAEADLTHIHKLWEGLGYYTRARNMQRAAQVIRGDHNGAFPREFEQVLALPGIGPYTAGAICSIAYNQPTPILDGNVVRVLARVFDIEGNPRERQTRSKLWELAENLVKTAAAQARSKPQKSRCSILNQSLMELGALICTPREPRCPECPVRSSCLALKSGRVGELPNMPPRPTQTARRFLAFVAERRGRILVRQRPPGVVNGHLWEFPNVEVQHPEKKAENGQAVSRVARFVLGRRPEHIEPLCTIKHTITRYRITLEAFRVRFAATAAPANNGSEWLPRAELAALPFTSAHKRILERLA